MFNLQFDKINYCSVRIEISKDIFFNKIINSNIMEYLCFKSDVNVECDVFNDELEMIVENCTVFERDYEDILKYQSEISETITNKEDFKYNLFDAFDFEDMGSFELLESEFDVDDIYQYDEEYYPMNPLEGIVENVSEYEIFDRKLPYMVGKFLQGGNFYNEIVYCIFGLNKPFIFLTPCQLSKINMTLKKMKNSNKQFLVKLGSILHKKIIDIYKPGRISERINGHIAVLTKNREILFFKKAKRLVRSSEILSDDRFKTRDYVWIDDFYDSMRNYPNQFEIFKRTHNIDALLKMIDDKFPNWPIDKKISIYIDDLLYGHLDLIDLFD